MKEDKIFIDTNIIIYAYDNSAGYKQKIASDILIKLWNTGNALISTQVLEELFVNITRKIPNPLAVLEARTLISDLMHWDTVVVDNEIIINSIDIFVKHRFSFWDSLIMTSAVKGGASFLYSEDFQHGITVEGIKIINPFI